MYEPIEIPKACYNNNNNIVSSRGSFAQPSYGVQTQPRIYLLIGQELVFEHEYAVGMCHMQ